VQDFLKAAVRPEVLGPDVGLLVRGSDLEELRGARMEQIAAPDSAYLTEHTAKLVEGLIQLQDLGKLAVKGVTRRFVKNWASVLRSGSSCRRGSPMKIRLFASSIALIGFCVPKTIRRLCLERPLISGFRSRLCI
jgi:hypothetical protein